MNLKCQTSERNECCPYPTSVSRTEARMTNSVAKGKSVTLALSGKLNCIHVSLQKKGNYPKSFHALAWHSRASLLNLLSSTSSSHLCEGKSWALWSALIITRTLCLMKPLHSQGKPSGKAQGFAGGWRNSAHFRRASAPSRRAQEGEISGFVGKVCISWCQALLEMRSSLSLEWNLKLLRSSWKLLQSVQNPILCRLCGKMDKARVS